MKSIKTDIVGLSLVGLLALAGCAKTDFAQLQQESEQQVADQDSLVPFTLPPVTTNLKNIQDVFIQDNLSQNIMSVNYQVANRNGMSVQNLRASDFEVFENGRAVQNFKLAASTNNLGQKADIVFVFDVSGSMKSTMNSTVKRVAKFVDDLKARSIQANLCLVTFTDETKKSCQFFVQDDPATAVNENLEAFKAELANQKTLSGTDEDQLRALVDAAQITPWRAGAQRMAILLSDESFHYLPDNPGSAKRPISYESAASIIRDAEMSVFTVALDLPGYNADFTKTLPALHRIVGGSFFDYEKMSSGKLPLDSIFNSIIDRLSTRYTVEYNTDQNSNLNPNLPDSQRNVEVRLKQVSDRRVTLLGKNSNYPSGRPQYKKSWNLNKRSAKTTGSLKSVFVNDVSVTNGAWIENQKLVFLNPPPAGARIKVAYVGESRRDQLDLAPVFFDAEIDPRSVEVVVNGVKVDRLDLIFSRELNGNWVLEPIEALYEDTAADKYLVARKGKVVLEVSGFKHVRVKN